MKYKVRVLVNWHLGQLDDLTLCTELYLAKLAHSSGGLANPGRAELLCGSWGSTGEGWGGTPTANHF